MVDEAFSCHAVPVQSQILASSLTRTAWEPRVEPPTSPATEAAGPPELTCFHCGRLLSEAEREAIRQMEEGALAVASDCNAVCFTCAEDLADE